MQPHPSLYEFACVKLVTNCLIATTSSSEGESGSGQCSKVFSGPVGRTFEIVCQAGILESYE